MSPQAASGCAGGLPSAYLDWVIARGGYMADEASSPYHPHHLNFTCPSTGQTNCHCPDVPDDHPGVGPHTSHQPPGGAGGAGGGPRRGGGDSPGAGLPPWSRAGATSPLAAPAPRWPWPRWMMSSSTTPAASCRCLLASSTLSPSSHLQGCSEGRETTHAVVLVGWGR